MSRLPTPTFGNSIIFKNHLKKNKKQLNGSGTLCCEWERWSHITLPVSHNDAFTAAPWQQVTAAFCLPAAGERITQHKNTKACNYFVRLDIMQISGLVWVNGWCSAGWITAHGWVINVILDYMSASDDTLTRGYRDTCIRPITETHTCSGFLWSKHTWYVFGLLFD